MRPGLLVMLFCTGCLHPNLVECEDGLACSAGSVCDTVHGGCVNPEQLGACDALEENADCEAGPITGGCFGGVCLPRGCGNGVVEDGEMCDDRNQVSGDGCRKDCLSNEKCGNGVTDTGETCDDGNLISRDECDSHCVAETVRWTTIPISPLQVTRRGAFDESTKRYVIRLARATWEWDGADWHVYNSPRTTGGGVGYYDTDRQHVVWISDGTGLLSASEWVGGIWSPIGMPFATSGFVAAATYDPPRQRALVFVSSPASTGGTARMYALGSTGTWTPFALPQAITPPSRVSLAYNLADDGVVMFVDGTEYEWTPSVWSGATSVGATLAMAWDPQLQLLVGLDDMGVVRTRSDAGWLVLTDAPTISDATPDMPLWVANNKLCTMDRTGAIAWTTNGVAPWSGTDLRLSRPFNAMTIAADPTGARFVVGTEPGPSIKSEHVWTWKGAWSAIVPPPPAELLGRFGVATTYDPDRKATIFYAGYSLDPGNNVVDRKDVWMLEDSSFTRLSDSPFSGVARVIAHDPVQRRLRVFDRNASSYTLAAGDVSWVPTGVVPLNLTSYVWDAKNHRMVGTASPASFQEEDSSDGSWSLAPLGPLVAHYAVANARVGAVDLLPISDDLDARLMRRDGLSWVQHEILPLAFGATAAYNARDGSLMFVTSGPATGSYAAIRELVSPTPLETCIAGEDADTDGLAGCDDPDCFWACTGCPPYTTCATSNP